MKALLAALTSKKPGAMSGDTDDAPASEGPTADYKQIAKDAAKDGDWDAFVDAMCAYSDGEK